MQARHDGYDEASRSDFAFDDPQRVRTPKVGVLRSLVMPSTTRSCLYFCHKEEPSPSKAVAEGSASAQSDTCGCGAELTWNLGEYHRG